MRGPLPAAVTDGRAASWIAAVILLAFPTVGMLAKHGMSTLGIALAVLLGALLLLDRRLPWPGWALVAPVAALLAVQALDLLVAPSCPPCADRWPQAAGAAVLLLPLAAGGMVGAARLDRALVRRALVAGVLIGALVALVELGLDAPIYRLLNGRDPGEAVSLSRYNRGIVALVLLALVAGGVLWGEGRRVWAVALLAAVGAVSMLGISLIAHLCLLLGLVTLVAGAVAERLVRVAMVVVVAVQMLSAPWAANAVYDWVITDNVAISDLAIRHRLELWDHGGALARERPWTGWGLDAFDHRPIDPERLAKAQRMTKPEPHPHNAGLQLWVETGVVGVLLGIAFLAAVAWRIGRLPRALRPWATALLAVGLLPGLVSFGLWQTTYLAMAAVAAFAVGLLRDKDSRAE